MATMMMRMITALMIMKTDQDDDDENDNVYCLFIFDGVHYDDPTRSRGRRYLRKDNN